MKICFFGSFDKNYSKNVVLLKGLTQKNVQVIHCYHPNYFTLAHYPSLLWQFLTKALETDIIYVAVFGHYDVLFAFILGKIFRKIVIFDPLISIYNTRVEDRKYFTPESFRAKFYIWFDSMNVALSDLVVMDTWTHFEYWHKNFGLKKSKTILVRVGADETVLIPKPTKNNKKIRLLFYGSYQPSQGALNIIETANLLRDEGWDWTFIGNGQQREEVQNYAKKHNLEKVKFIDSMSFEKLSSYINNSDIVFGALGTTIKTNMVIHNKIFQGLAMGKVVVTSDTDAVKEIIRDNKEAILVKADPKYINKRIKELIKNKQKIDQISNNARELFLNNFTSIKIAESLILGLKRHKVV